MDELNDKLVELFKSVASATLEEEGEGSVLYLVKENKEVNKKNS